MSDPRVVSVIYSTTLRGAGTEDSPLRRVQRLHSLDGTLLAEYDPCDSKRSYVGEMTSLFLAYEGLGPSDSVLGGGR